jgi:hypothetical protein
MHKESFANIDDFGTKYWKNESGKLHRLDGPALEYANGDKHWYQNGMLYRLDGPTKEYGDGTKAWHNKNGELHRLDGPAVEWPNGNREWYQNGKLHRIDGPAIQYSYVKEWYLNNILFKYKEEFFDALNDYEKSIAIFSSDFINA